MGDNYFETLSPEVGRLRNLQIVRYSYLNSFLKISPGNFYFIYFSENSSSSGTTILLIFLAKLET